MFCDLVGSTSISAKLDAEDWRDLVGGYLDSASAAVKEMGGHVAKKLGDGIMALFGYPLAQKRWIVPLFGTRSVERFEENIGALSVRLSEEGMRALNASRATLPVQGARYPDEHMRRVGL
jgi:class 3 adenylate cyclase